MAEAAWKVHKIEQQPRERMIAGIERRYLSGAQTTLAQIFFPKGALVPEHTHPNEQVSFIVTGAVRFTLGGDVVDVGAGEVLVIPPHMPHSAEALEETYDLDFFSPRREDWISGNDAYLRGPAKPTR
ncbi:MAG: cupin domain-containing protein [Chloroflexota bacterium]|nr:cupin domain-containing protein [Chloroflexota bacterium]